MPVTNPTPAGVRFSHWALTAPITGTGIRSAPASVTMSEATIDQAATLNNRNGPSNPRRELRKSHGRSRGLGGRVQLGLVITKDALDFLERIRVELHDRRPRAKRRRDNASSLIFGI